MDDQLYLRWQHLVVNTNFTLANTLFTNLAKNYHYRKRHYHNFNHIAIMLELSDQYSNYLQQKDVVNLAIFYHDVIYNPLRKDNEERSARRAARELKQLQVPKNKIDLVERYILATKIHDLQGFGEESDLAYLLDFDLSVLGADWEAYVIYAQNIRKEYSVYPDFMYNPGRVQVLQHFLEKSVIYFTNLFYKNRETKARENIMREITALQT